METKQPVWKVLYSTDCERVFTDETGVYPAEIELADEVYDAEPLERFIVHRFPLERFKVVNVPRDDAGDAGFNAYQYLVPFSYDTATHYHNIGSYVPWFAQDLESIADTIGTSADVVRADLCSADPRLLAKGYNAIVAHWGGRQFRLLPYTDVRACSKSTLG